MAFLSTTSGEPQGKRIGWLDGTNLYLEPEASYAAAQDMARKGGDGIGVTSQTLRKRLKERGLLASVDAKRETLTIRRKLEGKQRDVLHLVSSRLEPPAPEEPDKPDIENSGGPSSRPMSGAESQLDTKPDIGNPDATTRNGPMSGLSGSSTISRLPRPKHLTQYRFASNHPTLDPPSSSVCALRRQWPRWLGRDGDL